MLASSVGRLCVASLSSWCPLRCGSMCRAGLFRACCSCSVLVHSPNPLLFFFSSLALCGSPVGCMALGLMLWLSWLRGSCHQVDCAIHVWSWEVCGQGGVCSQLTRSLLPRPCSAPVYVASRVEGGRVACCLVHWWCSGGLEHIFACIFPSPHFHESSPRFVQTDSSSLALAQRKGAD